MRFTEPFAQGESLIHRLDARLRVLVAAVCSVVLAVAVRPVQAECGLAAALLLVALSRPPFAPLCRRLLAVNCFVGFLWLTVPFSTPGEVLARLGPFVVSREGVALMSLITLKANAIALLLIALIATMPVARVGHALQALGVPGKFAQLLLFTYRAIFLLAGEWERLRLALKLRGFVPAASLHTYRTLGNLLGLTLVRSLDRAGRIHQAMLLRGFTGQFKALTEFRWQVQDTLFALVCGALLLCSFIFLYFTL